MEMICLNCKHFCKKKGEPTYCKSKTTGKKKHYVEDDYFCSVWEEAEAIKKPTKKVKVSFDPLSNVEAFYDVQPFFYDKSKMFWVWNFDESFYEMVDETDIMNMIEESLGLYGQTIASKPKNEYLEAFKRIGRLHIPKEPPVKWVQFKNKAISLKSGKIYNVTPDYFFTNPIPWCIGDSEDTPTMDRLFKEWVGEQYVQDLYEIIAYCCYREYPIQVMFCLYGTGRNGKSQFMKLLIKFLGTVNTCSTELDALANPNNRFESFKLYKKLMCSMGETNFGTLNNTSMLKKLVGGDLIGYEVKNKNPFDDFNYAKIIIGSNSLPSTDDTTDGYMRRWHIIDFPNEFPEGKDIIKQIPDQEFNNLARRIMIMLPKLIEKGAFCNQGSIKERMYKYAMASNPLPLFIEKHCEPNPDGFCLYNKLYTDYVKYLIEHKKRKIKRKEFKSALENEGFYVERTTMKIGEEYKSSFYIMGLDYANNVSYVDNSNSFSIEKLNRKHYITNINNIKNYINFDERIINYIKCNLCEETECNEWEDGKFYCRKHFKEVQTFAKEEEVR